MKKKKQIVNTTSRAEPTAPSMDAATQRALKAALDLAKTSPKRAFTAGRELAKSLGAVAAASHVLDAIADACLEKDNAKYAAEAFSAARAIDRKRGGAADPSLDRYRIFASGGAMDPREIEALIASFAEKSKNDKNAVPMPELVRIAIETIVRSKGERMATPEIVSALAALGGVDPVVDVMRGWVEGAPKSVELDVWLAVKRMKQGNMAFAQLMQDASIRGPVIKMLVRENDAEALDMIATANVVVDSSGSSTDNKKDAARIVGTAIRLANDELTPKTMRSLRTTLDRLDLKTALPMDVIETDAGDDDNDDAAAGADEEAEIGFLSWNRQLVDPAIVELLLSVGAPIAEPKGDPETYTFSLHNWAERSDDDALSTYDDLERVGKHPFFGRVLIASFAPGNATNKTTIGECLERAVRCPGCSAAIASVEQRAKHFAENGTLGALETHASWLEGLCQQKILERSQPIIDAIRGLDPARFLRNQLRAGIMDEWGWPAHEEALERFGRDVSRLVAGWSGPFPYLPLFDVENKRVIVCGPEGIVLEHKGYQHPSKQKSMRAVLYNDGDVLACSWGPELAHWVVSGGKSFDVDGNGFYDLEVDGAILNRHRMLLRRGERLPARRELPPPPNRGAYRVWFDGTKYYEVVQETVLRADGTASPRWRGDASDPPRISTFDPRTGKTTGVALPPWMAGLLLRANGDAAGASARLIVHIMVTFIAKVPERASRSPLGAKSGLGGFALHADGGHVIAERIDGRRAKGLVNGLYVAALMTFPERGADKLYPVPQSAFDIGICMPDGTTPLVPIGRLKGKGSGYWAGTPSLDLMRWHLLEPRDPRGSRALMACSDESARAIYDAAARAVVETATQEKDVVTTVGRGKRKMQAVMKAAAPTSEPPQAAVLDAIHRVLPDVTHRRLVLGVAGMASVAVRLSPTIERIKSRLGSMRAATSASSSTRAAANQTTALLHNKDAKALARIFGYAMHWWDEALGTHLGQQIVDVSRFLFSFSSDDDENDHNDDGKNAPRSLTPTPTVMPWDHLVLRVGEVIYRILALGTPASARRELAAVIDLWATTGFPSNASRVRQAHFAFTDVAAKKFLAGVDQKHPDRLIAWNDTNRYFLRSVGRQQDDGRPVYRAIEAVSASGDGLFRVPPGATLVAEHRADARFDADALRAALALVRERGPVPFDKRSADRIAKATGLGRGAASLMAIAGYDPWLASTELRTKLGLDKRAVTLAEMELRHHRLREIYARAMPDDPREMYDAPPKAADRLARAYKEMFGEIAPLPTGLVSAMRDDLNDDSLPLERDARTLMNPDAATVLTRDETWVVRPFPPLDAGARKFHGFLPPGWPKVASMQAGDENPDRDDFFQGYAMGRFARYVAWAHLEMTGGSVARDGAARMGALLRERLHHPDLLVLAGIVDLSTLSAKKCARAFDETLARFAKGSSKYRASDGGPSAEGRDRGDVVVTWPSEKKNGLFISFRPSQLEDEASLLRFSRDVGVKNPSGQLCSIDLGRDRPVIAPASFGHWLAWRAKGFQRLVDDLSAPLAGAASSADPRTSAPKTVASLQKKLALDEAAATLLLQRAALPNAQASRVLTYNSWSQSTYNQASKALAKLELELERDVKLTTKTQRALYGLDKEDDVPVFGVLLPLRPLGEIFADATEELANALLGVS